METSPMPYWVWVLDESGAEALINLNQIRMIQMLEKGRCRVLFGPNFTITLSGSGSEAFLTTCLVHAKTVDGFPLPEKLKSIIEKKE